MYLRVHEHLYQRELLDQVLFDREPLAQQYVLRVAQLQ
jgi:hypothetical protein